MKHGCRENTLKLYKRDDNITTISDIKEWEEEVTVLKRSGEHHCPMENHPNRMKCPLAQEVDELAIKVIIAIRQNIWKKGFGQNNGRSPFMYQYGKNEST